VHPRLAARQGYLGTRLYAATGPADLPAIVLVRWSSPLMYHRTLQEPEAAAALAGLPQPNEPALYLPVND